MRKLLLIALLSAVFAVAAGDISGTWNAAVETDAGAGSPTFVFKQDGEKLTGTYSGAMGEAKITGTVTGDHVEWTFTASVDGDNIQVKYAGTLEGASKMKGTVELGSLGKGTFTAEKK
jgi:hypothetical protein